MSTAPISSATVAVASLVPADGPAAPAAPDLREMAAVIQKLAGAAATGQAEGRPAPAGPQPLAAPPTVDTGGTQAVEEGGGETAASRAGTLTAMADEMRKQRDADRAAALAARGQQHLIQAEEPATENNATAAAAPPAPSQSSSDDLDLKAVSVLQANIGSVPKKLHIDDLDRLSKDPSVSEEMRAAYAHLRDNPDLTARMDTAGKGGRPDGVIGRGDIEAMLKDPALKAAGDRAANSYEAMQTKSVLEKHRDLIPKFIDTKDLGKLAEDTRLPPDLRQAYAYMRDHPEMTARLDVAAGKGHVDGRIGRGDLQAMAEDPALINFNREQAKTYTQNYIPSDATAADSKPRAMTASDANRELFLYADSLPDKVDRAELQKIVDGKCDKKCPAQLKAAAQFMLDNPQAFDKLAPGGSVKRGALEANAGAEVNLREDELAAIRTLQANKDVFLKGGPITRDSLAKLAADESATPEVRRAAALLASDPLVFGMLDNAKKGFEASRKNRTNDGKISAGDIDKISERLTAANLKAPAPPPAHEPGTVAEAQAYTDMVAGSMDDPAIKKAHGGGHNIFAKILGVVGKVLDVAKIVIDAVGSVLPPPFSLVAAAAGAQLSTINNFAVKAGQAMLNGASAKEAFKQAAINGAMDLAGSAMSLVPGGGVAKAGASVAKLGVEAAEIGAKAAAKEGAEIAAKQGAKEGAEAAAREGAEAAAQGAAGQAGKGGLRQSVKEGVKDGAKDALTEEAYIQAQNEYARLQQGKGGGAAGAPAPTPAGAAAAIPVQLPTIQPLDVSQNDEEEDADQKKEQEKKDRKAAATA